MYLQIAVCNMQRVDYWYPLSTYVSDKEILNCFAVFWLDAAEPSYLSASSCQVPSSEPPRDSRGIHEEGACSG